MTQQIDTERGEDPPTTIGATPPKILPDLDSKADPAKLRKVLQDLTGKGDRKPPNREDVLPYLMIRTAAGDRGQRPTWPPTPCWESPDILLIDAAHTGPFDPAQCVGNPTSGNTYRAFVRVFNLGRLPAVGVQVTLYWVDPGFFGPSASDYEPQVIGGAWVDLADRTRSDSVQVVEIGPAWSIPQTLTGHECLLAVATCIADPWSGVLDSNNDRRVGQRNLQIAAGNVQMSALLDTLGLRIPRDGTLELQHAGQAVGPLLKAVGGMDLQRAGGLVTPVLEQVRHGVTMGDTVHLLTAVSAGAAVHVVPTEALALAVPAIDVKAVPRYLQAANPQLLSTIAMTRNDQAAHEVLGESIQHLLGIGNLQAGSIAAALGGGADAFHLLRFVASDAQGRFVGGYSIIVSA